MTFKTRIRIERIVALLFAIYGVYMLLKAHGFVS